MKIWAYLIMCFSVAACGPLAERQPVLEGVQGVVSPAGATGTKQNSAGLDDLTRAQIDAADGEFLLFAMVESESSGLLAHSAKNGARRTWTSDEGISLTLHDGVIVATRGLGNDLMGADAADAQAAIAEGQGMSLRVHDHLGGEDQIIQRSYNCTVSTLREDKLGILDRQYATRLVQESCVGKRVRFKNLYWVDGAGVIWQSRQWISPRVGFVDIQRL